LHLLNQRLAVNWTGMAAVDGDHKVQPALNWQPTR
jgi:hypothetical protein